MTTYERSHPWLTFRVDLSRADPRLWIDLGEASSKCEHLARVPLRPSTAQLLHRVYLAKGVAATTAIEGNTLSEAQVLKAVEGTLQVPPSQEYLKQEVMNVIAACNAIGSAIEKGSLPQLSVELLCQYNRWVLQDLPPGEDVVPGELRCHSVVVGNVYRGAPAEDCRFLMEKLCDWLNGPEFEPSSGLGIAYAVLKAILAHLYLAWIHPFGDGNGRTARLTEFHLLLAAGVPMPAAHLLSNHYNQTRADYYRQLDYASRSGGDVLPFLRYAVRGLVDGLRGQLDFVWEQHWDIVWRNYVHERFSAKTTPAGSRQKHLALDLGVRRDWVHASEVPELTPQLAKAYAGTTDRTVQRDLKELEDMKLILRDGRRVRANRELILAFLPLRLQP